MRLVKLRDEEMSFKRWPRTLNEAFGPGSSLHIETPKTPLRAYFWMLAYGVVIGAGLYLLVGIRAGAQ